MENVVRALLLSLILLGRLATPAGAQSLQIFGYAGVLGEWELIATVTEKTAGRSGSEYHGPLTMTHVGLCTQDGPEQKTGEIRLQISSRLFGTSSSISATVLLDGVECTYSARFSDTYKGLMNCPDRRAVPLTLWLK